MSIKPVIANLTAHNQFTRVQQLIHEFLQKNGYTQVDVPVLSPVLIPESYLEIFETEFIYGGKRQKMYLTPSPELFLKRLMSAGLGSCYALTKSFRNSEPHTSRHAPEFTMLEFYKVNADYMQLADDVLKLFRHIVLSLFQKDSFIYRGKTIHLDFWEKITVSEAFKQYASIEDSHDARALFSQAEKKGYTVAGFSYSDVWSQIYTQEVEPKLGKNGRPTIIYDYPKELAAMVRFNKEKNVAERLEVYIDGVELGNCGNEDMAGADFAEFETRFRNEQIQRTQSGKISHKPDNEFIEILKNLPPCSGIAIGVERMAMILTDTERIEDLKLIHINLDNKDK